MHYLDRILHSFSAYKEEREEFVMNRITMKLVLACSMLTMCLFTPLTQTRAASLVEYSLLVQLLHSVGLASMNTNNCNVTGGVTECGQTSASVAAIVAPADEEEASTNPEIVESENTDPYMAAFETAANIAIRSCGTATEMCDSLQNAKKLSFRKFLTSYFSRNEACKEAGESKECKLATTNYTLELASAINFHNYADSYCKNAKMTCSAGESEEIEEEEEEV